MPGGLARVGSVRRRPDPVRPVRRRLQGHLGPGIGTREGRPGSGSIPDPASPPSTRRVHAVARGGEPLLARPLRRTGRRNVCAWCGPSSTATTTSSSGPTPAAPTACTSSSPPDPPRPPSPGSSGAGAADRLGSPRGRAARRSRRPRAPGQPGLVRAQDARRRQRRPRPALERHLARHRHLERDLAELGRQPPCVDARHRRCPPRCRACWPSSGLATESMVRDPGWQFMDAGRRIERGIQLAPCSTPPSPPSATPPADSLLLESVLTAAESIITYRRRYRSQAQIETVLDLVLLDAANPRSLAFQLDRLARRCGPCPGGRSPGVHRDERVLESWPPSAPGRHHRAGPLSRRRRRSSQTGRRGLAALGLPRRRHRPAHPARRAPRRRPLHPPAPATLVAPQPELRAGSHDRPGATP